MEDKFKLSLSLHTPQSIGVHETGTQTHVANDLVLYLTTGCAQLRKNLERIFEQAFKYMLSKRFCEDKDSSFHRAVDSISAEDVEIAFLGVWILNDVSVVLHKYTRNFYPAVLAAYTKEFGEAPDYDEYTPRDVKWDFQNWLFRRYQEACAVFAKRRKGLVVDFSLT